MDAGGAMVSICPNEVPTLRSMHGSFECLCGFCHLSIIHFNALNVITILIFESHIGL